MLSEEEALLFVRDTLGLSSEWRQRREHPKQFIHHLVRSYLSTIPFQSATSISTLPEERHRPSLKEIKELVLSGKGGMCYVMNVFFKYLLDALGYQTYFIAGNINHPNNHILVVIVGLEKPGDKFLVDAGVGYPTFDPMSLDVAVQSQRYCNSYMAVHLTCENEFVVMNFEYRLKDSPNPLFQPGVKRRMCKLNITPRELGYFDVLFDEVYTNPDVTPFHRSLRICTYTKPEGRASIIKDSSHICEDESHCLKERKIGYDELLQIIENTFPVLKLDTEKAIKHLNLYS